MDTSPPSPCPAPPQHCHWVLCCTCICYSAGLRRTRGECLPHPWIPEDAQGLAQSRYGIYVWTLADPEFLLSCSSVDSLILNSAPLIFSPCTWCFSPEALTFSRKGRPKTPPHVTFLSPRFSPRQALLFRHFLPVVCLGDFGNILPLYLQGRLKEDV